METFVCVFCGLLRDAAGQPALMFDPEPGRWRACVYCAVARAGLCNGCARGVGEGGAVYGGPGTPVMSLCGDCRHAVGWDGDDQ